MWSIHMWRILTIFWQACQIRLRIHFTVKGHKWVSLTYFDFNSYLVITRLIHKERLGVCNIEITEIQQFLRQLFSILASTEGWAFYQIFKKGGGLDRFSICRWGLLGKREMVTLFKGTFCSFYIENELKPEISNNKRSL